MRPNFEWWFLAARNWKSSVLRCLTGVSFCRAHFSVSVGVAEIFVDSKNPNRRGQIKEGNLASLTHTKIVLHAPSSGLRFGGKFSHSSRVSSLLQGQTTAIFDVYVRGWNGKMMMGGFRCSSHSVLACISRRSWKGFNAKGMMGSLDLLTISWTEPWLELRVHSLLNQDVYH